MAASAAIALATLTGVAASQASRPVTIRNIGMTPRGTEIVVTIAADGLLPPPPIGVLNDPPRIYLDFAGIGTSAPTVTRGSDSRIRRIRASTHTASPLVTRVVIDLTSAQPHQLELEPTRIRIVIGATPAATPLVPGLEPVPPLPDQAPTPVPIKEAGTFPGKEAGTFPGKEAGTSRGKGAGTENIGGAMREPMPAGTERARSTPAPRLSAPPSELSPSAPPPSAPPRHVPGPSLGPPPPKELEKYRRQASTAIDRLRLQQPMLMSLDANESQTVGRLRMAADEFERLREELSAMKPPDALKAHHDMLIQSSTMALMAMRLRIEGMETTDAQVVPGMFRNAASAAAGAILLLDRACADLGCPAPPGR